MKYFVLRWFDELCSENKTAEQQTRTEILPELLADPKKTLFKVLFCCWPSNVQKMIEKYFKRMPNVLSEEEVISDKQSKVNNHIESGEEGIP